MQSTETFCRYLLDMLFTSYSSFLMDNEWCGGIDNMIENEAFLQRTVLLMAIVCERGSSSN